MHILVTGGTGFIGRALCAHLLQHAHKVTVLTRDVAVGARTLGESCTCVTSLDEAANVDAVINLAGEPLFGKRWNEVQKQRIVSSRADATRSLVAWMRKQERAPAVLISASAVGYYGDRGDDEIDETAGPAHDFAAQVCVKWEQAALEAEASGVRVCVVRIGIVVGKGGGLLAQTVPLFKKGLGGRLGSGRQWMPWVDIDDVVGLIDHALTTSSLRGVINCSAPVPVTNREFTRTLGAVLGKPTFLSTPAVALRIVLGESSYMVLTGQRALPRRAQGSGYAFRYERLEQSLRAHLGA